MQCSGTILAPCNLRLPGSSNSPALASPVAGTTGAYYHSWRIFVFLVEAGFHHVGQAGLNHPTSSDPPDLTSLSAGITGVSQHAWPPCNIPLYQSCTSCAPDCQLKVGILKIHMGSTTSVKSLEDAGSWASLQT